MSTACVFCKIVTGKLPCFKVFENKKILAFLDIDPVTPGHTLLVPRKHVKDLYDITPREFAEIAEHAKKVARVLKKKFKYDSVTLWQSNGKAQDVPHFHLHVFGRNSNNDIKVKHPKLPKMNKTQMTKVAERIREEL